MGEKQLTKKADILMNLLHRNVIFDRFDDICFDVLCSQNGQSFLGKFQLKTAQTFNKYR